MSLSNPSPPGIRSKLLLAFALTSLLATGCATVGSTQSTQSNTATAESTDRPNVSTVIKQPTEHQNSTVRWGGTVVAVENREDATWIEVVDRPLNSRGRPLESRLSDGRFLAIVPGFLDPADYRVGRAITISGTINGSDTRKIGDADYNYPKVVVADHQLWLPSNTRVARGHSDKYGSPLKGTLSIGFGSRSGISFFGSKRFGHGRSSFRYKRSGHGFRNRRHFRRRH